MPPIKKRDAERLIAFTGTLIFLVESGIMVDLLKQLAELPEEERKRIAERAQEGTTPIGNTNQLDELFKFL